MEDKTMKKVFGIAALLLALVACNKIETQNQPAGGAEGIPFSATVSLGDSPATKALAENGSTLTATWDAGEKVALIHNSVIDEMTVSSVSGGSATITGTITGTPTDGDAVTIIYPSSAADGATGDIKTDLLYAQNGLLTGEGSISECFEARKGTGTLKVDGTATLSGGVSLANQFAIFKFTVKNYDGSAAISASPLTITIGTQDYVITPVTATDVLYAALTAASGEKVSFDATDADGKTYTCAKLSVSFEAGKYYQSTLKMREYVDLGIVVDGKKIKWATCNVGASKPEDYGDYYAWGEVEPYYSSQDPLTWKEGKTGYNWASYKWCNGAYNKLTKYCPTDKTSYWDGEGSPDGKTVLEPEDDAAHVSLGSKWRMPTDEEWTELRTECTWTRTTQNGVNGRLVTGKNGNSIFLPAAGSWNGTNLNGAGNHGYYWSSSLTTDDTYCAWTVYFYSDIVYRDYYDRFRGFSVRPVTE